MRAPNARRGFSGALVDLLPATDTQLVGRIAQGDARALEQLYDRYVRQCFGLALRIVGDSALAEEIVQETFLKVWTKPDSYAPQKGQFVSWLLSMVHHRCIDELRRRSRTEVALEDPATGSSILDTEADSEPDPGDQVWLNEQRQTVRQALSGIAPEQRRVLEMAYYGGLSQSEIAARLKQPLGTVKTRMRTGIQQMRKLLAANGLLTDEQ
jgi:RNA polymerase sigma-70 factor (ECF subfamily)